MDQEQIETLKTYGLCVVCRAPRDFQMIPKEGVAAVVCTFDPSHDQSDDPDGPWSPPPRYQGRLWDAPMTDDAVYHPASFFGRFCDFCSESIEADDDALALPHIIGHLECHVRSGLGDVQHLEKRCLCFRGAGNEISYDSDHCPTYRASAQAALTWVLEHNAGRFRA